MGLRRVALMKRDAANAGFTLIPFRVTLFARAMNDSLTLGGVEAVMEHEYAHIRRLRHLKVVLLYSLFLPSFVAFAPKWILSLLYVPLALLAAQLPYRRYEAEADLNVKHKDRLMAALARHEAYGKAVTKPIYLKLLSMLYSSSVEELVKVLRGA